LDRNLAPPRRVAAPIDRFGGVPSNDGVEAVQVRFMGHRGQSLQGIVIKSSP